MNSFQQALTLEIKRVQRSLSQNKAILEKVPKGYLTVRSRSHGNTYYWTFHQGKGEARKTQQICINDNKGMITSLTDKRISTIEVKNNQKNLLALQRLSKEYKDTSFYSSLDNCSGSYRHVILSRLKDKIEERLIVPYDKCPYNPERHIHITDYGECVRSKSEQILANSFYAYGIPFHYEEKLFDRINTTSYIYPDFTILLPRGGIIIWEHLGMLSKEDYCIKNARKLNFYQKNGFVLGDNLILTMDDDKGNFSSSIINQIIQTQILPKLCGIEIDKAMIIKGTMASYL